MSEPANRPDSLNDAAPDGEMRSLNDAEEQVFRAVWHHGKGTPRELALRLARNGVALTLDEVQTAVDSWFSRGWFGRMRGRFHLSQAAINYMR